MRRILSLCLVGLLLSCCRGDLFAQANDSLPAKRIVALRVPSGSITVDGRLDDGIWRSARFASDFSQKDPIEGAPPSERTEIAFLYDDHSLYVGARMRHTDPANISSIVTRRDNSGNSERIIVSLDTYHDHRTAYSFSVTAAGVRTDYYHATDEEYNRDYSFDPVWDAHATIDSEGWSAEMRIPFSQLRFSDDESQTWGVNIDRYIPTRNEDDYWIVVPKNSVGWSSRFGDLTGISGVHPSTHLELLPYVASNATFTGNRDPNDPYDDGRNLAARAGLDMKLGLGPNMTLDATVNPDFGQVEADPAEVNLSAFETYFDERRPFFVEGSELFTTLGPNYFYSRRIGAAPHASVDGDYVERPLNTTILGAAKLIGRLPSGTDVGVVGAVSAREDARVFDVSTGSERTVDVEPLTGFGVVRLQQEFGQEGSTTGLILTGVRRDMSGGDPLATLLARQALAGGADLRLRFDGGEYELLAHSGFSYVEGDSDAITRIQRNSAHYFQRPDASQVAFDPSRRSLGGYNAALALERNGGRHWLWHLGGSVFSPGFDVNDLGIFSKADVIDALGTLTYRETEPGPVLRSYSVEMQQNVGWNFDGVRTYYDVSVTAQGTWANFWGSYFGGGVQTATLRDRLTRGGPLMRNPRVFDIWGGLNNNVTSTLRWNADFEAGSDEYDGWYYGANGTVTSNIGDRWEISVSPSYSRALVARQFVTDRGKGETATFGTQYVFAHVDRSTLSMRVRVKFALTPDLNLELYGEPFAASGRFFEFGELAAAGSGDLLYFGERMSRDADGNYLIPSSPEPLAIGNPDFFIRSFRSNAVLRWEWLPGSTLFLVWQQDRGAYEPRGDHVRPLDLVESSVDVGTDYLALKLSYWFPVD